MKRHLTLPTIIAAVIGLAAVTLLLYAWHLPPFRASDPETENAYVRGKVTSLAPQLSGYLSAVEVADFQAVKAGDVIARIDDRIFRQRLAQAEAGLAATQAALKVAEQNVRSAEAVERADQAALAAARSAAETAESDAERARELRARGVASETASQQADLALQRALAGQRQAEAQLDVQRENINSALTQAETARAQIASATATVELARIDLDNTTIHAPADGRLGQVAARVGQYVTAGTVLVSHVGTDLWVVANFKETAIHGIQPGAPVRFTVDALGGQAFRGHVEGFSPATASEFSLLAGTNATGNFTKIAQRLPIRIAIDPGQPGAERLAPGFSVVVAVDRRG